MNCFKIYLQRFSFLITETLKTVLNPKMSRLLVLLIRKTISLFLEKEQQRKKAKKNAFLAKGNFLKKKAEVEKLSYELQTAKGK